MNSAGKGQRLMPFGNTYRARSSCTSISEERSSEPEDPEDCEEPPGGPQPESRPDPAPERTLCRTRRASCAVDWRYQNHRTSRVRAESPSEPPATMPHKRQSLDALACDGRGDGRRPRGLSVQVDGSARARLGQRRETLKWAGVRVSIDEDSGKVENENVSVDLDPLKNIGKEVGVTRVHEVEDIKGSRMGIERSNWILVDKIVTHLSHNR